MNKKKNNTSTFSHFLLISTLTLLGGNVFSETLMANGALPYCFGSKMCQMGGAGVAIPLDSLSGNVNPALMANVGNQAGLDPIIVFQKEKIDSSRTQLTRGTPLPPHTGPITNRIKTYGGAYLGFNYVINPEWSVGISTAGGGTNARYKESFISPALSAPRRLETMAALSSQILAYKPSCDQSYGVSLIAGYLQMKNNLTLFPSGIPTKGHDRTDHAWGIGARLGGQWNVNQFLSLGAAASTPTYFQKLKKYNDVILHAPRLPPIVTGGLALHVRKDTDVLFDLEGLFWNTSPFTGKKPPAGQGWRNVLVFKFGVQHKVIPDLTVRLGYNHGRTAIRNKYVLFNALDEVIALTEQVLSTGFTYNFTPSFAFDLGGTIAFNKTITDNGKGPAGPAAKGLSVKARSLMVNLGFNIKY